MLNRFKSIALCLTLAGLPVMALAAEEGDAESWLEKMGRALREESYEGIFTYMRGYQFDTVKVVHKFEDGKEKERLLHLNGDQREVLIDGDTVTCRHEPGADVDLEREVSLGPFTHAFNENLANYQSFYDFTLTGHDRVAGRPAIRLEITPKNNDRYGYKLWLDEATGLLLQSHLISQGHVLEVFQFSRVDIGDPVDDSHLLATLTGDVVVHQLAPNEPDTATATAQARKPDWRVAWLPNGFRQVRTTSPNRILFSDGIATFSIFVEQGKSSRLGEIVTHMGGTVVITRRLKNTAQQITVVGEVPVDTAKRVAESVEPVIY
ncbi:MAG: MucB/RseB C-terminal domain-containing protein [Pseudomonadales bacterium]|nr:MucB/RseB C-terminal domain-containing protein [Pseudomonadales bacterium]